MKKGLKAFLAMLIAVIPFTAVSAATNINGSVREYQVGDEVNFYRNDEEKATGRQDAGLTTVVLSTEKKDGKYVKSLVMGSPFGTSQPYYDKNLPAEEPMQIVKRDHKSEIDRTSTYTWDSALKVGEEGKKELDLAYISLDELVAAFGATKKEDGTYTIDVAKWGKLFEIGSVGSRASKGFYTSTYDIEKDTVWVVEYTWKDGDYTTGSIEGITVKTVAMNESNEYAYIPVVYFDETYDCHYVESAKQYACYSCDSTYTWTEVGTQAETCTLVENVNAKKDCATTVPTGVEDYILEFAGVAAICAVALVIVKRKDLFRSI